MAAQAWLSIRLQMIGIALIGGVCVITAVQRHLDVAHSGIRTLTFINYQIVVYNFNESLGKGTLQGFLKVQTES